MDDEIWYDIPDFEGHYQYSDKLRFKSLTHTANAKNGGIKKINGKLLKIVQPITDSHYPSITLSKDGIRVTLLVHVFFATIFIPNPENKKHVNHKNGNKKIYALWNLEWATKSEDLQHAYDTGLKRKGKEHHWAKNKATQKGGNNSRLVLDLNTGIFYDNCIQAASAKCLSPRSLARYLRGDGVNKTSMIYA